MSERGSRLAPVAMLARAGLRRRWLSVVAFGVLFGVAGGIGIASLAGAHRTSTLFHRHLVTSEAPDIEVDPGRVTPEADRAIRSMPGVTSARYWVTLSAYRLTPAGQPDERLLDATTFTTNGRYLETDRIAVARGRRLDPRRADEVMVNESYARVAGVTVGSRLRIGLFEADQDFVPIRETPDRTVSVTVVGIMVINEEITAEEIDTFPRLFASPALKPGPGNYLGYSWYGLRLADGQAGAAAIQRRWDRLAAAHNRAANRAAPAGASSGDDRWLAYYHRTADLERKAARSVRPLTTTLAAFGLLVLLAAAALAAQSLSRTVRTERADGEVAQVLGLTPGQAVLVALALPLAALALAAGTAVAVAVVGSLLFPVGPFVVLEPSPGLHVDTPLIGGLLAVLILVPLATVSVTALRVARSHGSVVTERVHGPGRLGALSSRSGASPPFTAALRLVVEPGRGRSFVPTRSMLVSVVVTVATLVTVLEFGGNLSALDRDPHRFGWPSDGILASDGGYSPWDAPRLEAWLRTNREVTRWRLVSAGEATVSGQSVPAAILGPGFGGFSPTLLEGRAPRRAGEVVLGAASMKRIHADVGDEIPVGRGARRRTARITGTAVFPVLGPVLAVRTGLDTGAWFHVDDYHQLSNIAARIDDDGAPDQPSYSLALIDVRPGVDLGALQVAIRKARLTTGSSSDVMGVLRPSEVRTATAAGGGVQLVLGALLALAAGASLLLTLGVLVRRRRSELAVYRILGFTPGQVRATLVWQGLLVAGCAVVIGVPVGVAVGRTLWRSFASRLGVVPDPLLPVGALAAAAVATLVVGLLSAVGPALAASRVPPAVGVRVE